MTSVCLQSYFALLKQEFGANAAAAASNNNSNNNSNSSSSSNNTDKGIDCTSVHTASTTTTSTSTWTIVMDNPRLPSEDAYSFRDRFGPRRSQTAVLDRWSSHSSSTFNMDTSTHSAPTIPSTFLHGSTHSRGDESVRSDPNHYYIPQPRTACRRWAPNDSNHSTRSSLFSRTRSIRLEDDRCTSVQEEETRTTPLSPKSVSSDSCSADTFPPTPPMMDKTKLRSLREKLKPLSDEGVPLTPSTQQRFDKFHNITSPRLKRAAKVDVVSPANLSSCYNNTNNASTNCLQPLRTLSASSSSTASSASVRKSKYAASDDNNSNSSHRSRGKIIALASLSTTAIQLSSLNRI